MATAVKSPEATPFSIGLPKTLYNPEEMACVVGYKIPANIEDGTEKRLPFTVIDAQRIVDAGSKGIFILSDWILKLCSHECLIPGPEVYWRRWL